MQQKACDWDKRSTIEGGYDKVILYTLEEKEVAEYAFRTKTLEIY